MIVTGMTLLGYVAGKGVSGVKSNTQSLARKRPERLRILSVTSKKYFVLLFVHGYINGHVQAYVTIKTTFNLTPLVVYA